MPRRPPCSVPRFRPPRRPAGTVLFLLCLPSLAASGAEVRGIVRDARGGEPLEGVKIVAVCGGAERETRSGRGGEFSIGAAPECSLAATLVGYRTLRLTLREEAAQVELALVPEFLARSDAVTVEAGPFEAVQVGSPSERTLTGAEMKNLAPVLIDDPLRAVQALPGVAANNDFNSEFALRGASFDRIGLIVEGILFNTPFHSAPGAQATGSLTMLNGDAVEEMSLHAGAPPVAYSDRSAGVLDIRLREGSRRGLNLRASAGVAAAGVTAEGPLGRRGSWIAAARKSYLQYLLRRSPAAEEPTMAFDFVDVQSKLSYDLSPSHSLTAVFSDGVSDLDRSGARAGLGVNALMLARFRVSSATLAWRYVPSDKAMLTNRIAAIRERCEGFTPLMLNFARCAYGEWVWNADLSWSPRPSTPFQAGSSFRRLRDEGETNVVHFIPQGVRRQDPWRGTGLRSGVFAHQSWNPTGGRISGTAGVRADWHSEVAPVAFSPHASVSVRILPATSLQFAASTAVQYPDLQLLTLQRIGNPHLPPIRSNHFVAAIEQRLGDRTRLRLEAWERYDRDLPAQPLFEPRLLPGGRIFHPPREPLWTNSHRARARGFEVFLHRRSANRLSGWVSYSYGHAVVRDAVTQTSFHADFDQRHAVSAFGSIRLRPTVSLSSRYAYGSNFPVPGWFRQSGALYFLAETRNLVRLPAYHRADIRVTKAFQLKHVRGTLFIEVTNLTDRHNRRFDSFAGYHAHTGRASPRFQSLFPILPAAGLMFEWNLRESNRLRPTPGD